LIASAVHRSDAAYSLTAPGLSGEDRGGHDRCRHQRPASAHALSARCRCLLLAFSIVSVGTVIVSLRLPRTVLRFVAESMTRNQLGRARRAPAWRYCGLRAENIRGGPTIPHTCLFGLQGFGEASERFTTDLYAAQKIRVRPLCRSVQDGDEYKSGTELFMGIGALGPYRYEAEASPMTFSSEPPSDSAR
jgi:hypothetical protein